MRWAGGLRTSTSNGKRDEAHVRGESGVAPIRGSSAIDSPGGDKATLRWIVRISGRDFRCVWWMVAASVGQSLLGLGVAWMFGQVIDRAVALDGPGFWRVVALLSVVIIVQISLSSFVRWLAEWANSLLENRFRAQAFASICERDLEYVSSLHSGEWTNRMGSDAQTVANGVTNILPGVVGMSVRLVGAIVMLVAIIPESGPLLIGGGVLLGALATLFRKQMKRLHRARQEAGGRLQSYVLECLQGLLVVHSFAREKTVQAEADARMADYRQARLDRNNFSNLCNTGFAAAMDGAYVLGVCYCGWRLMHGTMSYGTLVVVAQLVSQVQGPFANLSGFLPRYYAMLASAERLMEPLGWPLAFEDEGVSQGEVRKLYQSQLRAIRLSDVTFSYGRSADAGQTLRYPTFELRRGEALALTGRSGCGKSTLIKLLMGVYEPAEGTRTLVLRDSRELAYGTRWRGLFAYVPQDDVLMSGTVRDVVAFGSPDDRVDDRRVWDSLRIACADGFVRELPLGLDTMLGERGSGLSGGQSQRLAIARAVCSGHPVIVLDEATSALDAQTEAELLQNLRGLGDRTLLMVTHRPATMAACDRRIDLGGQE
jgi:ATP-binding cassette subfamily B protein